MINSCEINVTSILTSSFLAKTIITYHFNKNSLKIEIICLLSITLSK